MSTRRMFPDDPPRITFTKDFRTLVHGDLLPGRTVTIVYDAERLPEERSKENNQKVWTIKCFYKFLENGEVRTIDLESETGEILTKITHEPGEGTMMVGRIWLPEDADHLTVWFLNTGRSSAQYWDSNFARNYVFRFVVEDLQIERVAVDASGFHIEILASPEVEDLAVLYRIMNAPDAHKEQDTRFNLTLHDPADPSAKRRWSGTIPVPKGAVVRFVLAYTSYGNPHSDTNSGKGYLTWAGAERNREAGVLVIDKN
jgi:Family of unknown function (DUF6209)